MSKSTESSKGFLKSTLEAAKAYVQKAKEKYKKTESNEPVKKDEKPIPLKGSVSSILSLNVDSLGRPIDEHGMVIDLNPKVQRTLMINKTIQAEQPSKTEVPAVKKQVVKKVEPLKAWHDSTLIEKKRNRKGAFCFIEKDKYVKLERQMQREIEDKALGSSPKKLVQHKKRYLEIQDRRLKEMSSSKGKSSISIQSQTDDNPNLIPLGERKVEDWEEEPEIEWWDIPLLKKYEEGQPKDKDLQPFLPLLPDYYLNHKKVTFYISHPSPLKSDEFKSHSIPTMYLTVKERKKLRRRKRQENERAKQDKIRIGLIPPPPPKLRLSNLNNILSAAVAADPSQVENDIRAQIMQRYKAHCVRNEARKLKPEEKSRKHANKWKLKIGDVVYVALFSISSLENSKLLFKIDINAQHFHLTGVCLICPDVPAMIVVEGSLVSIKRYRKLLLNRMDWGDETCKLLWQGQATHRNFGNWKVSIVCSEAEAKETLGEHTFYYDMLKDDYISGTCEHPLGITSIDIE